MLPVWSRMPEYYKTHPLESPSSPTHNPYSWTNGMEGQDWIKVIGRTPESMRRFAVGISVRGSRRASSPVFDKALTKSLPGQMGHRPRHRHLSLRQRTRLSLCSRPRTEPKPRSHRRCWRLPRRHHEGNPPSFPPAERQNHSSRHRPGHRPRPRQLPAPGARYPSHGPQFLDPAAGKERVCLLYEEDNA